MRLARQEAQNLNHGYIATEHLLLGLLEEGSGLAANILRDRGINFESLRASVLNISQKCELGPSMGQLLFTPRAKKAFELALEEADNLGHTYIGTEHLLLGLILEAEGVAGQVLLGAGLTVGLLRHAVIEATAPKFEPEASSNSEKLSVTTKVTPIKPESKFYMFVTRTADGPEFLEFEEEHKLLDFIVTLVRAEPHADIKIVRGTKLNLRTEVKHTLE